MVALLVRKIVQSILLLDLLPSSMCCVFGHTHECVGAIQCYHHLLGKNVIRNSVRFSCCNGFGGNCQSSLDGHVNLDTYRFNEQKTPVMNYPPVIRGRNTK